jgi:hypothetical protein
MKYTRTNDRCSIASTAVKPVPQFLEGVWFNTDPGTGEIAKVVITVRNGTASIRAFGADTSGLIEWGETPVTPYVDRIGSSLVTGFFAEYDFGFMKTRLAANVKYGVLVIQTYNEFSDDSGRPPYFTGREFFSREVIHCHQALPPEAHSVALGDLLEKANDGGGTVDLSHHLGHWTNANPDTSGIPHFDFHRRGNDFYMRAFGAGYPECWGEVIVTPHALDVAGKRGIAFLARYVFEFVEITLAVNENKGLIIIASYHRFKDASPRSDYFKREFFYHEDVVRR